ncbi:MAG: arylsulfatase [Bryobacterales bacterium]|nr:arylsulfatase [Acidobacteriota bacterium]MCB9384544.1 arylsulfatase [Bryobacterales bacterium]
MRTVALLLGLAAAALAQQPPNIVLILADDFGVGDIQAHYPDNKIATPYLDRLVSQSVSFSDAHSPSAVCTPTRYGLLTGRYSWRTRLQEWVLAAYEPPLISDGRLTLPSLLREQGYSTAMIGKWHLGWDWPGPQPSRMNEARNGNKTLEWDFGQTIRNGPTTRGFDYYFGVDLPNMPPFTYIENDHVFVQPSANYAYDPDEGVVMPRTFDGAPMAPGWKFADIVPELTKRAVGQIKQRAKQGKPFFLYYAMTSPHEPVVPSKRFEDKSGIAPIADFVMETDWSAGQVLQAIDDAGIADNTVVIFTADNGHSHYTGWQDLVDAGHKPSGPYRGHKGDIWEGGHRVPLVVRWPGHAAPQTSSSQMVSLTDVLDTCAEIAGAKPSGGAEDSISFLPAVLGKANPAARTTLINHSNFGEFAYRDGPWKLVFRLGAGDLEKSRGKATVAELYNLDSDIAEAHDLAHDKPEMVKKMTDGLARAIAAARNDGDVHYDRTQTVRWIPAAR